MWFYHLVVIGLISLELFYCQIGYLSPSSVAFGLAILLTVLEYTVEHLFSGFFWTWGPWRNKRSISQCDGGRVGTR